MNLKPEESQAKEIAPVNVKQWTKEYNANPKGDSYWIRIWQWIALLAFFSGAMLSAAYYSLQVNMEIENRIDEIVEQNPQLLGPYFRPNEFYGTGIIPSWNDSINVTPIPDYVSEDQET